MDVFKAFAQQVGIVDPFGPGFLSVIITFLVALVFTWFFMPRLREFAVQAGWADMPNARRLNKEPLPNAGGLGIFVGFVVSMVLLATAAQFTDRAAAVVVLAGLAGACMGYLRYNSNPSRIIMGDAGAYLIGFTLAAVSLLGTLKVSTGASLIVPLIVLALPVVDTTQVVIGRLARGIRNPLGHPDKTHIHHRVLARTASARRPAVILWVVALTCGALGMLLQGVKLPAILSTVVVVAACLWFVAHRRVRAHNRELELNS